MGRPGPPSTSGTLPKSTMMTRTSSTASTISNISRSSSPKKGNIYDLLNDAKSMLIDPNNPPIPVPAAEKKRKVDMMSKSLEKAKADKAI